MGFTVSSLTNYVDQTSQELLTAAQFKSETAGYANIQTGIKSAAALQILTNSPVPQDGAACGFNASGDTAFTQRTLTTAAIKYQDSLCPRTLEAKWTQMLLKQGQMYTESDIPGKIFDDIILQINRRNETADWQGDTTVSSAFLKLYDGLVKIIGAASPVTATSSTYNATNARAIIKNIITNIPAALKGDPAVKIFMGYDAAETYRQALMDANLFHVATGTGDQKGLMAEGSVHEIIPVHGLDVLATTAGKACIFTLNPDRNLYMGVDAEGEEDKVTSWLDGSDNETVKYSFRFRRGWQIAFGAEIVQYSNT